MNSILRKGIIVGLLLFGSTINAQEIRLYSGHNLNHFSKSTPGFSSTIGLSYFGGLDAAFYFKKRYFFQPGLQYIVTQTRLSHPVYSDAKSDLIISGLKIPVMVGASFNYSPASKLRIFCGPTFTSVLNVKNKNMDDKEHILTDKNYHDVEWAAQYGIGFCFYGRFTFDMGIQNGLTYIFTGDSKSKSSNIFITIGILPITCLQLLKIDRNIKKEHPSE